MLQGSGFARYASAVELPLWQPLLKRVPAKTAALLFTVFLVAALATSLWVDTARFFVTNSTENTILITHNQTLKNPPQRLEIPLNCSTFQNQTKTCPANYPKSFQTLDLDPSTNPVCPDYFRWIHEDLKPWKATGITKDMVERANRTATFRLVVVQGKAYVEKYRKSIQTRDVFTIWGILQLLRRYPGRLPDLELMFDTEDRPIINSKDHRPPPLFRYCGDERTLDIVFPDWSFWGWAEINIKPWHTILDDIKEGNNRSKWIDRQPYAYWKGNPFVDPTRQDLLKCNISEQQDWNARLYIQDWILEGKQGFKQSNVADQCTYRYKIYIEGYAWSVSEKYILACDSVTLYVNPRFYDFFSRSLQPVHHYWPIRDSEKCKSLKFAVDWLNSHKKKAQEIGRAASSFMQEEVKMDNVYDYMYHLLNEYGKLLRFQPKVPEGAVELCSEAMACPADGREKKFMMESLVKGPSITSPCRLPPPYERNVLASIRSRKDSSLRQVQKWENRHWETVSTKQ